MTANKRISLIGAGKVGTGLHQALIKAGYAAELIGKNKHDQLRAVNQSDVVLITVQDAHIEQVCHQISESIKPNTLVAHCSGAVSNTALISASQAGGMIGSAHPLNSFPSKGAAKNIFTNPHHNTYCFISGCDQTLEVLTALFSNIGFNVAVLNDEAKVAYHTACVFVCNYLTSLAELSLQMAEMAGLDRAEFWQATQPLVQTTLANISANGTNQALSGPIARGDVNTIKEHLAQLQTGPDLANNAYRVLGLQALELAQSRQELDAENLNEVKKVLTTKH